MARIARVVAVGHPHHITQRGNYRQEVFRDDKDRQKYLTFIQEYSCQYKLNILVYCLMSNHVHFIGIPEQEDSLAKTFNTAHMRYSQYFNKKMGAGGHLWQGRFYSCVLGETHLAIAARYVERNPVRAKLVKEAWQWQWSSAIEHSGKGHGNSITLGHLFSFIDGNEKEWKEFLKAHDDEREMAELKRQTMKGLPVGTDIFVKKLEKKLGKVLRAMPRGRPWHKKENK
jgi:putative transposase